MIITHTYNGYELSATYYEKAERYYPSVTIMSLHDSPRSSVMAPPCPGNGFGNKDDALILGIGFARDAVDGKIKNFCLDSLQFKKSA